MFLKFYYKILDTHKVSCDMYVSNKVSTREPSIQLKKQQHPNQYDFPERLLKSLPSPIFLWPSLKCCMILWFLYGFTTYICVLKQSNISCFKVFKKNFILFIFTPFTPSILFLRFMHWLQNQTFWACIQALPRNCWVALSKLPNFALLQLFSYKIGIIIVPTTGLLEEWMSENKSLKLYLK